MILEFRPKPICDFDHYFEMDYVGGMGRDPGPELREIVRVEHHFFNSKAEPCWMVAHDLEREEHTEIGFVAGCHIADWAVEELLCCDAPFPHPKFLRWYLEGRDPFIKGVEVARANANDGLNLITTHFGWDRSLTSEQAAYVRSHVLSQYANYYSGLRYKRMLAEVYSEVSFNDCVTAGFRLGNEYPNWFPDDDREFKPVMFVLERDRALNGNNFFMMSLFAYQAPRILFSDSQRELLLLARAGYSDRQAADTLYISEDTVKARWKSINAKVFTVLTEMLPGNEAEGRGPEKRRALMAYLQNHPSEFWPYKSDLRNTKGKGCRVP